MPSKKPSTNTNARVDRHRAESVLLTGASSGIGAALAVRYARPGVTLFLGGRDAERLEVVAAKCRARGALVEAMPADVTDRAAMRQWVEACDAVRPLDLVIANAGISGGSGGERGEEEAQVRAIFDVNLSGVLNTIWPALPHMRMRGYGQIAMVASLAGLNGWPGAPAYSASKAAVIAYGEGLAGSLAGTGVRVSVICPGFIRTPMTDVNGYKMPFLMSPEKAAAIIERGLRAGTLRIAFPWQTRFMAVLIAVLPSRLRKRVLGGLPRKPAISGNSS